MSNRIRCPGCGRGVRLSNNARKVVRHRVKMGGVSGTDLPAPKLCHISGLSEGEVKKLRVTIAAFRPAAPEDQPIPGWKPRWLP